MRVEIWSDVMCPFCYIGKRRFEKSLKEFDHRHEVEIEWKSFQLNPEMETDPDADLDQYLSEAKGMSLEEARQMNKQVTEMAEGEGLKYHMDQAVVANSFDAHRLIQLAKTHGKADAVEEALFYAYFTESKNIADHDTLVEIAENQDLDGQEVRTMLESDTFTEEVNGDIAEARQLGIQGVPFFAFDRDLAVVGAQPTDQFTRTFKKAWEEAQTDA